MWELIFSKTLSDDRPVCLTVDVGAALCVCLFVIFRCHRVGHTLHKRLKCDDTNPTKHNRNPPVMGRQLLTFPPKNPGRTKTGFARRLYTPAPPAPSPLLGPLPHWVVCRSPISYLVRSLLIPHFHPAHTPASASVMDTYISYIEIIFRMGILLKTFRVSIM